MNVLLDERTRPPLRSVIGRLLAAATHAEIAVSQFRLALMDLTLAETAGVQSCRVLLDRLDTHALAAPPSRAGRYEALLQFVLSERVEIRSAGVGAWQPDFSIYRGLHSEDGRGSACLVGAHWFGTPRAEPSLTCALVDDRSVALALDRFEQLWAHAHDVHDVIVDAVQRIAMPGARP